MPVHPPSDEDLSTLSEQSGTPFEGQRAPTLPALVLLWLTGQLQRSGEVCTFPIDEPWGPPRVLGRGEASKSDPHRRVQFLRQLPGGTESAPPLSNRHISRVSGERARAIGGGCEGSPSTVRRRLSC
jgi:hypothetical protein